MSEVITRTVVELEKFGLYHQLNKAYIDTGLSKKWESATFDEATRKVSFYTVPQPSGETAPVFEFTLPEVDFTDVYTAISAVENKADANTTAISNEVTRATEAEGVLTQAIEDEKTRAEAAEKLNSDAITVLNGDANTEGSVSYAVKNVKDELTTEINKKADSATTLEGYGITDAYTKTETDNKINVALTSALIYKGTVSTYDDLPIADQKIGDVYNIATADATHDIKAGDNVAWNGFDWDVLAGTVDLSAYSTTEEVESKISTAKQEAISTASEDATTKANTAESNANTYTNTEIAKTNANVSANTEAIEAAQTDATSALEQIAAIQYATEDDIRALFA